MGDIINAANTQSEISARDTQRALTQEQVTQRQRLSGYDIPRAQADLESTLATTNRLNKLTPAELADLQAQTVGRRISTEQAKANLEQFKQLQPLRLSELQTEIDNRLASGKLTTAQADRLRTLAPLDLDTAKAELARLEASIGSISQQTQENKVNAPLKTRALDSDTKVYEVVDPVTGNKFTLTGKELPNYITGQATAVSTEQNRREIREETRLRISESLQKDTAERLKDATLAESNLIQPPKTPQGKPIHTPEGLAPYTEQFNSNSDKPYVYIHIPKVEGKIYNTPAENKRFDLPQAPGTPLTARMIYFAAKNEGMTTKQYLEDVFYPAISQRAPWLPPQK